MTLPKHLDLYILSFNLTLLDYSSVYQSAAHIWLGMEFHYYLHKICPVLPPVQASPCEKHSTSFQIVLYQPKQLGSQRKTCFCYHSIKSVCRKNSKFADLASVDACRFYSLVLLTLETTQNVLSTCRCFEELLYSVVNSLGGITRPKTEK